MQQFYLFFKLFDRITGKIIKKKNIKNTNSNNNIRKSKQKYKNEHYTLHKDENCLEMFTLVGDTIHSM